MTAEILQSYADGNISDLEALRAMALQLGEVESDIAPLEAERKYLREQIGGVVARLGGKAEAAGYRMTMTADAETTSYDARAVDALLARLLADGYPNYAEILAAARRTGRRAGSLRVERAK